MIGPQSWCPEKEKRRYLLTPSNSSFFKEIGMEVTNIIGKDPLFLNFGGKYNLDPHRHRFLHKPVEIRKCKNVLNPSAEEE